MESVTGRWTNETQSGRWFSSQTTNRPLKLLNWRPDCLLFSVVSREQPGIDSLIPHPMRLNEEHSSCYLGLGKPRQRQEVHLSPDVVIPPSRPEASFVRAVKRKEAPIFHSQGKSSKLNIRDGLILLVASRVFLESNCATLSPLQSSQTPLW